MRLFRLPSAVLVEAEGGWFRLPGESWDTVVNRDDLMRGSSGRIAQATLIDGTPDLAGLLPPIGSQEVWAAGVTYFRSRTARMEESKAAGGGDFYDRVYDAAAAGAVLQGHAAPRRAATGSRCASAGLALERARSPSWR